MWGGRVAEGGTFIGAYRYLQESHVFFTSFRYLSLRRQVTSRSNYKCFHISGRSLKNRIRITPVQSFSCAIFSAFGHGAACSPFLFPFFLRGGLISARTTVGGCLLSFPFVFSGVIFGSRDDRSLCCVVVWIVFWAELSFGQSSQGVDWGSSSIRGIGMFLQSHWHCGGDLFRWCFRGIRY